MNVRLTRFAFVIESALIGAGCVVSAGETHPPYLQGLKMRNKSNGELLKTALDAVTELERRGNKLEQARRQLEFMYEDYLGLKSLAASIAALDPDRDEDFKE